MLEKKVNQKQDCRAHSTGSRQAAMAMTNGKAGSALIMTVVLTVLLSIVAVMFVMVARMDSASTSNIVDSKTLDNAAKSIIEIIGKELVLDTPGVASQEYQDYPDVNDAWLASIEPYGTDKAGIWRQISDVTGYLRNKYGEDDIREIPVKAEGLTTEVVRDYPVFDIDGNGDLLEINKFGNKSVADNGISADADGDGIADSKWIELDGLNTSKGKEVFAAIRVIDNCAMLNVNTAYKFDDTSHDRFRVDGTSQLQINLEGLLKSTDNIDAFHKARGGADDELGWNNYENDVIWDYNVPGKSYLPFDISDELELRYRYCIDSRFISRFETDANITATIRGKGDPDFGNLYDTSSGWGLGNWQTRITDTNDTDDADRRHLLTTYSFDRIIDPNGSKMWSVYSSEGAQYLYERLADCIDANHLADGETENDLHAYLAQFAANMVDRSDSDANVSVVINKKNNYFYGDEKPYIYISEIARNFEKVTMPPPIGTVVYRSYAVELFKEYEQDANAFEDDWQLEISNPIIGINIDSNDFESRGGQFCVKIFGNFSNSFAGDVRYTDTPKDGAKGVDPAVILRWDPFFMGYEPNGTDPNKYDPVMSGNYDFYFGLTNPPAFVGNQTDTMYNPGGLESEKEYFWQVVGKKAGFEDVKGSVRSFTTWSSESDPNSYPASFSNGSITISLWRMGDSGKILVDSVVLPPWLTDVDVNDANSVYGKRTFQRDIRPGYRVRRIWDRSGYSLSTDANSLTLGHSNGTYSGPNDLGPIQLWHHNFTNVGDAAMLFAKKTVYLKGINQMGSASAAFIGTESDVRFDINSPSMQNVFKYITALNPRDRSTSNDVNETRVRGRININTAPAFVIAQLPWVSRVNRQDLKIADAIVAYRDMSQLKASDGSIVLDYTDRSSETGIDDIYESPGFRSVGELLSVINKSGKDKYNIRYCGMDNGQQFGFPDLTYYSESMDDGVKNDLEEQELIFARISDLATVRSDTFTAYILVRVGVNGPQKRFIAILDRTGVKTKDDKVNVAAFQQVPAAR